MNKKKINKTWDWKLRKYGRFLRVYVKRVRMTEREIGGSIESC